MVQRVPNNSQWSSNMPIGWDFFYFLTPFSSFLVFLLSFTPELFHLHCVVAPSLFSYSFFPVINTLLSHSNFQTSTPITTQSKKITNSCLFLETGDYLHSRVICWLFVFQQSVRSAGNWVRHLYILTREDSTFHRVELKN